ncbi:MAG: type II toxin-antitoxin system VapC family toxin [Deltaproteobacteria bacterium]|nr:type II toxin-antitoxin system VapC family toxin [Deltaproteobacteria bacterium]MBW1826527.1 type II toxin-antitoxin system VapC family toxin [Deltaproteobacteria bacterium]MBW1970784.1 type II toxin-antitoxin system VapC family toxin [Deltaproteobacteria bacterium]MBW2157269.1 type II toxin-antitoxin system VapC family toxin [Deltaproteobacteria bacterium]MBW2197795.1 type II toxin-antitoxin system VapC family toxin [Deltaproteobacteria bacterium]
MRVCVDTAILLDILKDEFRNFQDKLYTALARRENLVAPSVVYAELMPQFKGDTKLLDEFLEEHKIAIEPLGIVSVIAAAQAWMKYLKRKKRVKCPQCGLKLNLKKHFLSDFYIGGFASTECSAILTRDRGIYTKYFPELVGYEDCLKASSR